MNKYTINGHGTMLKYYNNKSQEIYPYITIPKNVIINTFVELGDCLLTTPVIQHITCGTEFKTKPNMLRRSNLSNYKFKTNEKIPNFLFSSDDLMLDNPYHKKTFYSGIVHCDTNTIIYNIDANKEDNCSCDKINSIKDKPYVCDKNYYIEYDAVHKDCGPISLKDAIDKIKKHACHINHINDCELIKIEINILTCLNSIQSNKFFNQSNSYFKNNLKKYMTYKLNYEEQEKTTLPDLKKKTNT